MRKLLIVAGALSLIAGPVSAHSVWIEQDSKGQARAYFGEWDENVREKTGALLDRISNPKAFLSDPAKTLTITREPDHLKIEGQVREDVRLLDNGTAPRDDRQAGGKTLTLFEAKSGRRSLRSVLDLELVPTAPGASTFVLMLRGVPLPKTAVKVFGPPRWEKELRTDDQGRLTIPPWAGRYVVEVVHVEAKPGVMDGVAYDRIRHVSTLSVVSTGGIPWKGK